MDGELRLVLTEEHAESERLDRLAGFLREELLQLDVDDVTLLRSGAPPPGARALDMVAVGGLIVSFGRSASGLQSVVTAVRRWLTRGGAEARRAVRLELDGDVLEISAATAADQDRLIELFIGRHGGTG